MPVGISRRAGRDTGDDQVRDSRAELRRKGNEEIWDRECNSSVIRGTASRLLHLSRPHHQNPTRPRKQFARRGSNSPCSTMPVCSPPPTTPRAGHIYYLLHSADALLAYRGAPRFCRVICPAPRPACNRTGLGCGE